MQKHYKSRDMCVDKDGRVVFQGFVYEESEQEDKNANYFVYNYWKAKYKELDQEQTPDPIASSHLIVCSTCIKTNDGLEKFLVPIYYGNEDEDWKKTEVIKEAVCKYYRDVIIMAGEVNSDDTNFTAEGFL